MRHSARQRLWAAMLLLMLCVSLTGCLEGGGDSADREEAQQETIQEAQPEETQAKEAEEDGIEVYVTETGSKYHSAGCRYLRLSCIPRSLDRAKRSYDPCSRCRPPQ